MAKILVIDDDTSLLQLIKNALENDHNITTYTGLSGVSIRDINTHDLLILDVMMPELDGFTFLKGLGCQKAYLKAAFYLYLENLTRLCREFIKGSIGE